MSMASTATSTIIGQRVRYGLLCGFLVTSASLLAYWPAKALGLREGFWAGITAVVVSSTRLSGVRAGGRNQIEGAIAGSLVAAPLTLLLPHGIAAYLIAIMLCVSVGYMLGFSNAARLAGTTTLIICLVPRTAGLAMTLLSRIGEVAWGSIAAVGLLILWGKSFGLPRRPGQAAPD